MKGSLVKLAIEAPMEHETGVSSYDAIGVTGNGQRFLTVNGCSYVGGNVLARMDQESGAMRGYFISPKIPKEFEILDSKGYAFCGVDEKKSNQVPDFRECLNSFNPGQVDAFTYLTGESHDFDVWGVTEKGQKQVDYSIGAAVNGLHDVERFARVILVDSRSLFKAVTNEMQDQGLDAIQMYPSERKSGPRKMIGKVRGHLHSRMPQGFRE